MIRNPRSVTGGSEILTVEQMYQADSGAVAAGVPSIALMEAAGVHCAREIRQRWPRLRTAVFCGPGNNGGDGFVVARLLRKAGWPVRVGLVGQAEALRGDAAVNAQRWVEGGGSIEALTADLVLWCDLAVDALFGAGLTRPLEGEARATVRRLLELGRPCAAVDVPSGINGNTGEVMGGADGVVPLCDLTVTFCRPKPAHLLLPGRDFCGDVLVVDIGVPHRVVSGIGPQSWVNGPGLWPFPEPGTGDHKYSRGHAVVFGSAAMSGAARLAAAAARRAGAGLVTAAVPQAVEATYRDGAPGLMVEAMETDDPAVFVLADDRRNAVLIGPGYGVGDTTKQRVQEILRAGRAVVLDADVLTSFADEPGALFRAIQDGVSDVVLTPHEGEFAKLFPGAAGDKLSRTRTAAEASGAVVLLKGSDTVIAAPDGRASITADLPSWLATAGSGDVLAGIVTGLAAQGLSAWHAAGAGAWIHGAAARIAGPHLIAEDLVAKIPAVMA